MNKNHPAARLVAGILLAALLNSGGRAHAAGLATCWHIPDNASDLGFNMRNPESAIGPGTTVAFYTGVWKVDTGNGNAIRCNQTNGILYYKTTAQSAWSSKPLMFYSNTSANQYWFTNLNCSQFNFGDTVQYFFFLGFDGSGTAGSTNTWLYGNNAGSSTTGSSNTAAASPFTFQVTNTAVGTPSLTVNGVEADYTTTHVFVNEVSNDAIPLAMQFTPNGGSVTNVEIFSNLNRRDRAALDANGDGVDDGIIAPDGNLIVAGDDSNYYKAYTMTNNGGGQYSLTLNATKTGAYRLTARYKVIGNTNWFWYNSANGGSRRDHAVVVTPARARDISMYELNAMNICAAGTNFSDRSTFTDLYNGPGSRPADAITNRFNLSYATNLGVNWLWFQPIHPIGILNRGINPNTGQPYDVGSPYSIKNFFQINPLLSKANTRDAAMGEFTNFVAAAHAAGVNVMLDEPFNHTAWDCELDNLGTNYFTASSPTPVNPTDSIMNHEARFYSRTNEYDQRAVNAGTVAQAPDRNDFGKWGDVSDIYFGRYAALVANTNQTSNYTNEGDWFDTTTGSENSTGSGNGHFDQITQNVWRYFSDCVLYWLDKTGCPQGTPASQTASKGIDGVRADFGQGLPPQCWEYIINKTRSRKWDFVFMAESLDGNQVGYRSNRHFDILNENLIFAMENAAVATDYRNAFETRRTAYGQGLVLLNHCSHDEQSYADPYQALIRHAVCGTIDGAPMIFYGEELGISQNFGFNQYELNFGKNIPQFKTYNSMQPIFTNRVNGVDYLWPVYAAINQARAFSPALRSSSRYFLDQLNGSGSKTNIYSVAKYLTPNAAPNQSDVVFAFASLDRYSSPAAVFNVNITNNGANLFGIKPNRLYNVKNISAYTAWDANRRNVWLWGAGIYGSNVLANGVYVGLNAVPGTDGGWTNAPFEAQYLKLYDVTPPPAPTNAPGQFGSTNNYVVGTNVTFSWPSAIDAEGGISGYHVLVGTTPGGSNVFNGTVSGTTLTVGNSYGARLYATVSAINNAGIESTSNSGSSAGIVLVNPPVASMGGKNSLNWSCISGLTYQVWSTTNLMIPFTNFSGVLTASSSTLSFTNNPTNAACYYKIQLIP
jgi:Alpha amylase, catalytic domain